MPTSDSSPLDLPGQGPRARRSPPPTWLLVSPYFDGHHYSYLEHLVLGALARGYRVVVGVADDEQGARTRAALSGRVGDGVVEFVSAPPPRTSGRLPALVQLIRNELRRLAFLKTVFRAASARHPIDHVFLPHLDWTLFAMSVRGAPFDGTPYSGITMRQRFHLQASGVPSANGRLNAPKEWLFRRLLRDRTLRTIFTNDETLPSFFTDTRFADKVIHVPDPSDVGPTPAREAARDRLGIPRDACVVLAYGYLDARKGMPDLVAWVAGADPASNACLLLVGQQGPEVRALLSTPDARRLADEGRLFVHDTFVPEGDEPLYFAAADVVWLAYNQFEMMSGVLVKAAQYGRMVVFRDVGLIAHYARRYGGAVALTGRCASLLATAPNGLDIRTFQDGRRARALPDHSWSHALQLIYG